MGSIKERIFSGKLFKNLVKNKEKWPGDNDKSDKNAEDDAVITVNEAGNIPAFDFDHSHKQFGDSDIKSTDTASSPDPQREPGNVPLIEFDSKADNHPINTKVVQPQGEEQPHKSDGEKVMDNAIAVRSAELVRESDIDLCEQENIEPKKTVERKNSVSAEPVGILTSDSMAKEVASEQRAQQDTIAKFPTIPEDNRC